MGNKKLVDYDALYHYDERWKLKFQEMIISDNEMEDMLLNELGVVPTLPTSWTESANGTLDLSSSNAYSYWPEGAGTKTISIANETTSGVSKFFLKLTDAGNFPMQWGSNIQWKNGSEPVWQVFNEDIIMFTSNNGGSTWTGQVLQTNEITPYWKFTIDAKTKTDSYYSSPYKDYGHGAVIPMKNFVYGATVNWGDGTIETITNTDTAEDGCSGYGDVPFPMHVYSSDGLYQVKIEYDYFEEVNIYDWLSGDDADATPKNFVWYIQNVKSIDSPLPTLHAQGENCSTSFYFSEYISNPFDQTYYTSLESEPNYLYRNNA